MGRSVRLSEATAVSAKTALSARCGPGDRMAMLEIECALARLDRVPENRPRRRTPGCRRCGRDIDERPCGPDHVAQARTFRSRPAKAQKRGETAAIREACLRRCGGVCECGCGRDLQLLAVGRVAELDHMFGRGKGRLPQSVETCWILRADCHRDKTLNRPGAASWWRKFADHAFRHDYHRVYHAASDRLRFVEVRSSLPAAPWVTK